MVSKVSQNLGDFKDQALKLGAAVLAATHLDDLIGSMVNLAKETVAAADKLSDLKSRLGLVSKSTEDATSAWGALGRLAQSTRGDLESTVTLYTRMARALKETGATQDQVIRLTRTINESFKISGATSAEAASGTIQFAQALTSGTLRGDEFNSMMDAAPRLMEALAAGLGVSTSKLRGMAEAGELTTARITAALQTQAAVLDGEFARLPTTVEGATQQLKNSWLLFTGELGKSVQGPVASSLQFLSTHLSDLAQLAAVTLGVAAVQGVRALGGALVAMVGQLGGFRGALEATTGAAAALGTALKSILIVAAVEGVIAIGKLGKSLYDLAEAHKTEQRAAEATAAGKDRLRQKIEETLRATESYSKTALATGEQLAAMSRAEIQDYEERARKAATYFQALALQLRQAGDAEGFKAAQAKADAFEQSVAAAESSLRTLKAAGVDALPAIGAEAQSLVARFDELKGKGKETGDALKEMVKGGLIQDGDVAGIGRAIAEVERLAAASEKSTKVLKAGIVDAVATGPILAFGQALENLRAQNKISTVGLRAAWQDALKALDPGQLEIFQRSAVAAFGDSKQHAEQLASVLDGTLARAFGRFGIDGARALAGVSDGIRTGISDLEALSSNLQRRGEDARTTGEIMRTALSKLINEAQTTKEFAAIETAIKQMEKSGVLAGSTLKAVHTEVAEAQRKVGVSVVEVAAAQDKARISAGQFAQALKEAGFAGGDLNKFLAENPGLQALAAKAADDSRVALSLQAAQAKETGETMSHAANKIIDREYAQAAAFRAKQQAVQESEQVVKDAFGESIRFAKSAGDEMQGQFFSPYAANWQRLGEYGAAFQDQVRRLADQLVGTNDWWSDLRLGDQILARLDAKLAQADDLTRQLGSNDLRTLRNALSQATGGSFSLSNQTNEAHGWLAELGDQKLAPLNAAIAQATDRLRQLQQAAEDSLRAARNELDNLRGDQKAIEGRDYEAKKKELEDKIKQATGTPELLTKYREELAVQEEIHRRKLQNIEADEKAEELRRRSEQRRPAPQPAQRTTPAPAQPVEEAPELRRNAEESRPVRRPGGSPQAGTNRADPDLARQIAEYLAQIAQGAQRAAAEKTVSVRLEGDGRSATIRVPAREESDFFNLLDTARRSSA